jgi:parallel beta-helix repeat protein
MRTKLLAIILISFLGILNFLFVIPTKAESNAIYVCPSGCKYSKIQEAVDAARPGEIIIVKAGTYYENVVLNKSLTLKAEGRAIIDAQYLGNPITVLADNCTIEGFEVRNSRLTEDNAGIFVASQGNVIKNNYCIGNFSGIALSGMGGKKCEKNLIENNFCTENQEEGIEIESCNDTIVRGNTLQNNKMGIFVYMSFNIKIFLNNFLNNTLYNAYTSQSSVMWNSFEKINYIYDGKIFSEFLGNNWSDYQGRDDDGNAILPM